MLRLTHLDATSADSTFQNRFRRHIPVQILRTASLNTILTPMANGKGRSKYRGYNNGQSRSSGTGKPKKPPFTHFLCFPLVSATSRPQLEESLHRFQTLISTSPPPNQSRPESKPQGTTFPTISSQSNLEHDVNQPQLPAKAIRPVGTLHLTLGVMSLESQDRVEGAIKLLKSLNPMQMIMDDIQQTQKKLTLVGHRDDVHPNEAIPSSALSLTQPKSSQSLIYATSPPHPNPTRDTPPALPASSPISISLTSLRSMHDPKSTSILYADPYDSTDRLLPLGRKLRTIFEENGYMIKDTRPLKLHATVVNMIYVKGGGHHNAKRQTRFQTLGAAEAANPINATSTEAEEQEFKLEGCSNNHGRNTRDAMRFDATALLEQFKDFVWARDFRVEKVAICKMGAKKILGQRGEVVGEEYEEVAHVELP